MTLAPNLLNKPIRVVLANSASGGAGDAVDPLVTTAVLGTAAEERLALEVTVLAGEQRSSVIDCGAETLVSIGMPAVLTAGTLTLEVSWDGATWLTLKTTDGAAYTITTGASFGVPVKIEYLFGWQYVRLYLSAAPATNKTFLAITRAI